MIIFFLCARFYSSNFINYDLFSSSFSRTAYYFYNSSNSTYLSANASFRELSLFILLFYCFITVMFSIILLRVIFYIFSDTFRFYCFTALSSYSSFYIPFLKAASCPIILNQSYWQEIDVSLLSFQLLFKSFLSCSTFIAKLSINTALYCFSFVNYLTFFQLVCLQLLKPFLMAKIFSFIGIPSPKNQVKNNVPFLTGRFVHVFTNLSLAIALAPSKDTLSHLASLKYTDLIKLRPWAWSLIYRSQMQMFDLKQFCQNLRFFVLLETIKV